MSETLLPRIERFLGRSWEEKREIMAWHVRRMLKRAWLGVFFVRRLEPGFWWLAWNDAICESVLDGTFEASERLFVQRFLKRGMTVLDIGAYYGLYTLTARTRIGQQGRIVAFEPSPFQRKRLKWNLRINRCHNVEVESQAVGGIKGEQTLFSIRGESAGYASLRQPEVGGSVDPIVVPVTTLDAYLQQRDISAVDFIKVDVEGGELDVFRGAIELLQRRPRPVILCELEDIRTKAWGYRAKDCVVLLESIGYRWFVTRSGGSLASLTEISEVTDRNFVAVPEERIGEIKEMVEDGTRS
jgi:FkbM family methyltransferase